MKKSTFIILSVALVLTFINVSVNANQIFRNMAIVSSNVDSTPIGASTPSTGKFTSLSLPTGQNMTSVAGGTSGIVESLSTTSGLVNGQVPCWDSSGQLNPSDCTAKYILHGSATGCTTGSGAAATCNTTITWNGSGFPDTNYQATCTGTNPSTGLGVPYIAGTSSKATGTIVVISSNGQGSQAVAAAFGGIDCVGVE